jgi:hypothetical protein
MLKMGLIRDLHCPKSVSPRLPRPFVEVDVQVNQWAIYCLPRQRSKSHHSPTRRRGSSPARRAVV